MGRWLDILLGRTSRQMAKLKTLLGLTVSRLAVLRNHRRTRCSHARGDVAQLLRLRQQDRALLRSEQVIHEQDMLDAFVLIESYCHLLAERAPLLDHLRQCPDELREATSGLIFAAARCGDMPELQKVRRIVASQFGSEFAAAAVELRNNCGVNPKLIQKMSTRQPSLESKIRVTKEIAAEQGIAVDFEEPTTEWVSDMQSQQVMNPPVDKPQLVPASANQKYSDAANYTDAASAAQAAFESAAFAAAAARVAVELSRTEAQGRGPDNQSRRSKAGNKKEKENDQSTESKELAEDQQGTLHSNLDKSPTGSSSDSESFGTAAGSVKLNEGEIRGSRMQLDEEEVSTKHKPSYPRPPYRKGEGWASKFRKENNDDEAAVALGILRSRNGDDRVSSYYYSERSYPEGRVIPSVSVTNAGKGPVSMRTRKGF